MTAFCLIMVGFLLTIKIWTIRQHLKPAKDIYLTAEEEATKTWVEKTQGVGFADNRDFTTWRWDFDRNIH